LPPIDPFNEALHPIPPQIARGIITRESLQPSRFHTARVMSVGLHRPHTPNDVGCSPSSDRISASR
jgi:hypothetical protein